MSRRVHTAILGGGLAGVTTAWELHRLGLTFTLYEASPRLGGTVRTVRRDGFVIELGPDGWVSEKPWAAELARELGLGGDLQGSLDEGRVTHIVRDGKLLAMPDGMRMMVPTDLAALEGSPLFSAEAKAAYAAEPGRAEELRRRAPAEDESIANFVLRHFGNEVLWQVAAPLLAGVFGGSVWELSVWAVMPQFVAMEREYGSLILALQRSGRKTAGPTIFTTMRGGLEGLIEGMVADLPAESVVRNVADPAVILDGGGWLVGRSSSCYDSCDRLVVATPAYATSVMRGVLPPDAMELLPRSFSSAILVALAFNEEFALPPGFGFLVPPGSGSPLLACTFVDQKYPGRVPGGKRLLRAFFGGDAALTLMACDDAVLAALALEELRKLLGPLPELAFSLVQRWPLSLPQYGVGHVERIAKLRAMLPRDLHLVGNAYRGVGLPDIVREARAVARHIAEQSY